MTIRAKLRVNAIIPLHNNSQVVYLNAVYSTDPNSENKAFTDATPSAHLSIVISENAPAFNQFKMGQEYTVDFNEAQ